MVPIRLVKLVGFLLLPNIIMAGRTDEVAILTQKLADAEARYNRDTELYRRAIAAVNEMIAENLARRSLKSCVSMARSG